MKFRRIVQDYFTFSRNERKGITILLILIFLFAVANKFIFYFEKPDRINVQLLDSASHQLGLINDSVNKEVQSKKLFIFNPNLIDSIELDSLDLPEAVKFNLLRFRKKGGILYSNDDFKRIYGVTDAIFSKIEPYLKIESNERKPDFVTKKQELFQFDPNKATDNEFQRLGLSEKQITTIRKYISKGGRFYTKEDFSKIWGLSDYQKATLSEYIVIEEKPKIQPEKIFVASKIQIELNTADSITLKQLPGIGEKLSKRIIKYRNLLGGFYSISQLKEVYGLSELSITEIGDKVTIDVSKIKKLDLNFADVNELSKHPYIRQNLARQIIKFRAKNGNLNDLSILRDSMILNTDEYNKLKPYF